MSTSTTTHTPTSEQAGPRSRKRELLAGSGLLAACAVACSLPLLIGAGAAASITALLSGATTIAVVLLLAAGAMTAWWYTHRRRTRHVYPVGEADTGCAGRCGC